MAFPPNPTYPLAIDSDNTLFLVYNTSEALLTADNSPWSQDVYIKPVASTEAEVWANNGFANISGELFYYGFVGLDSNGKVNALKGCARNLDGTKTQFNAAGTWVRGFVIAEHHNQLVQTIINIENTLFDIRKALDILTAEPTCQDDQECPEAILSINVLTPSTNSCEGTTISFDLQINGAFTGFQIDFGDGNSTTSTQSGTHTFAANANIDPIVTVSNGNCQVVQTNTQRNNPNEPKTAAAPAAFDIPIPTINIPTITVPTITFPPINLTLPQIIFPELTIGPLGPLNIPSIILVEPPIPSIIDFGPVNIPSIIDFGPLNIPSIIDFGPLNIPSIISFASPPSFSPIQFGTPPTFSTIQFGAVNIPSLINFGAVNIPSLINFGTVNIPSVISIVSPTIPTSIILVGTLPSTISVIADIPATITVRDDIPTSIAVSDDIPTAINVNDDIPTTINVNSGVPSLIAVIDDIPTVITVNEDIPTTIQVNDDIPQTITVKDDIPSTITVKDDIPTTITLKDDVPSKISVIWTGPTKLTCTVTVKCPTSLQAQAQTQAFDNPSNIDANFVDQSFNDATFMRMDTQDLGIPTEIHLVVPDIPPISLIHDLPSVIHFECPPIPKSIRIIGPEHPIPNEIKIIGYENIPNQIQLVSEVPSVIMLESNMPHSIRLEIPEDLPAILIDASKMPTSIQIVGMPSVVELKGTIPSEIVVKVPDGLEVPMVYKGGPIPLKLEFNTPVGEDGEELPCFTITPCGKK